MLVCRHLKERPTWRCLSSLGRARVTSPLPLKTPCMLTKPPGHPPHNRFPSYISFLLVKHWTD